jgi:hypothetical protein
MIGPTGVGESKGGEKRRETVKIVGEFVIMPKMNSFHIIYFLFSSISTSYLFSFLFFYFRKN